MSKGRYPKDWMIRSHVHYSHNLVDIVLGLIVVVILILVLVFIVILVLAIIPTLIVGYLLAQLA